MGNCIVSIYIATTYTIEWKYQWVKNNTIKSIIKDYKRKKVKKNQLGQLTVLLIIKINYGNKYDWHASIENLWSSGSSTFYEHLCIHVVLTR